MSEQAGRMVVVAGMAAYVAWLVVHRHRLRTRQEAPGAGPATMELRNERPALVNLLVNGLQLTSDAVAATILDLAARRHLEIFESAPGQTVVRVRTTSADPQPLTGDEALILDAIRRSAGTGTDTTPAAIAATLGPDSYAMWSAIRLGVTVEAEQRGYVAWAGIGLDGVLFLIVCAVCAGLFFSVPIPLGIVLAVPAFFVLLLAAMVVLMRHRTQELTDRGRAAAAHWLGVRAFIDAQDTIEHLPPAAVAIWDRYLAYGVATGLSDAASSTLVTELRTHLTVADVRQLGQGLRQGLAMARAYRGQAVAPPPG